MKETVGLMIRGSLVNRYHNRVTVVGDTVGRHSCLVAWFCQLIMENEITVGLLMAGITHDMPEAVTCDMSAPVKRMPGFSEAFGALEWNVYRRFELTNWEGGLSVTERNVLKMADRLEGLLFSAHEYMGLGNRRMIRVFQRYDEYCKEQIQVLAGDHRHRARVLYQSILEYFEDNKDEEDVCGV